MKRYQTVLFDLDGTIIDSGIGVVNSVIYSLRKFGIEDADREQLKDFVGPPLTDSYEKHFGFSREKALLAVDYYREYYKVSGIHENIVYPGIPECLRKLKEANKTVIVTTSKPEIFAKQILEELDLAQYFDMIAGAELDGSKAHENLRILKKDVIQYAFDIMGITSKEAVVLVGDREHDVIGAKNIGIDCIGVLYGYGSREELETAGAEYLAGEPLEILDFALADRLCPCCRMGWISDAYDICDICGWENDPVQRRNPDFEGGANRLSLREYRKEFQKIYAQNPKYRWYRKN